MFSILTFDTHKRHYVCSARINGISVQLLLDTGAGCTLLSPELVCRIAGMEPDVLYNFMNRCEGSSITVANGQAVKVVPCFIRNVSLGSIQLPKFVFGICKDINLSVIGWDFIDACSIQKATSWVTIVTQFNHDVYFDNCASAYRDTEIQELLFVGGDNVAWFNSLPAEMKDKLHQWSTPLYTVLSLGIYLDEFDGVLDGFKKQYNL